MTSAVFATARLTARRITAADVDAMLAVYGDPAVVRFVADGKPLDRARCEQWVEVTLRNYETRGYGMVALVARADGRIVGFGGLVHPGGQSEPEIKYALRRDCWGRGYATEGARAALDFGFAHAGLAEIVSFTVPANVRSRAVMERVGMSHDPADDFDHPELPEGHPLRRHVLYRARCAVARGA